MSQNNALGEYLRARRDRVRPEDAGLTHGSRRRVPGLRREEVALLAGVSTEYYLRLEQGRDRHPSPQVLDALARALMLDEDAAAYLHRLGRPSRGRPVRRRPEQVSPGLRQMVMLMGHNNMPAFVQGRYMDVLVANPLATALSPWQVQGTNLLREAFLNPEVRDMYAEEWDDLVAGMVASVRALAGPDNRDPHLAELIGELSVRSDEFRRLWARHEVKPRTSGTALLQHPQVGTLELNHEKLAVTGTDGQILVTFHAAPDSDAGESLTLLAHLAATTPATSGTTPGVQTAAPGQRA
jgi:transcriptional regulator with XRE-family HTH domain